MALTLKSFEVLPTVADAKGKPRMNVPDSERKLSAAAGAAMVTAGLLLGGVSRWALGLFGAALMGRGLSGYCPAYHLRGENRRPVVFRPSE